MASVCIGVSKKHSNSSKFRRFCAFYRTGNYKKHWVAYCIDIETGKLITKRVSWLEAMILKLNLYAVRKFVCFNCGHVAKMVVRKSQKEVKCPNCDQEAGDNE